ncbi:unnamed protein product [Rhizophagus irregularis]|nr:unnamed protein product [Rhizophagus irregularis]CAB5374984.1 unnamed protein product [Rhizophagus irregularis]
MPSIKGSLLPDIGRKGSQLTVVHKRQDTRYRPKGVASHGGAQTVGRRSTITTESPSMQLSRIHADRHRPKGVATSGGAQTTGYQISAEGGRN